MPSSMAGNTPHRLAAMMISAGIVLASFWLSLPRAHATESKWWALGTFIEPLGDSSRKADEEMQANAPAWMAFNSGMTAASAGDHKAAVASFARAIELLGPENPLNAKVYAKHAQSLLVLGRNQEAIQSLTAMINLQPNRPDGFWSRARVHMDAQDYDKALGDYETVTRLSPNLVGAHMNLGLALYHLRRSEQALSAFENAMAAADKRYAAITDYWNSSQYAKSTPGFVNTILSLLRRDRDKTIAKAHLWLGKTHFRRSRFWEASRSFERAIKIAPDYELAYKYRGWLNEKMGYISQARADYKRAASLGEGDPWILKALRRVR